MNYLLPLFAIGGLIHYMTNIRDNDEKKLIMFYSETCPHCITTKPIFEKLGPMVNGIKLEMIEVSGNESNKRLARKFNVQGVPYIVYTGDGKTIEYTGERTMAGFQAFITSISKNP